MSGTLASTAPPRAALSLSEARPGGVRAYSRLSALAAAVCEHEGAQRGRVGDRQVAQTLRAHRHLTR
jgi:hypothetical protein